MIDAKASAFEALKKPALYVVATPIGHLGDISLRALNILEQVDAIGAEDTRHSKQLLDHYGIKNSLFSLHDHNEVDRIAYVLDELASGKALALISDAGTPLISDPGYKLVRALRQANYPVIPIPGPSAVMAALCAAGLPTDQFTFIGFLPAKTVSRVSVLTSFLNRTETLVCYESTHRIMDCLQDMQKVFEETRIIALAKELTKPFESIQVGKISEVIHWLQQDPKRQNGEFVLMIHGKSSETTQDEMQLDHLLKVLLTEMPVKTAVKIASQFLQKNKNDVYKRALELNNT